MNQMFVMSMYIVMDENNSRVFWLKKEWGMDICHNTSRPSKHIAKWKKTAIKHMFCNYEMLSVTGHFTETIKYAQITVKVGRY